MFLEVLDFSIKKVNRLGHVEASSFQSKVCDSAIFSLARYWQALYDDMKVVSVVKCSLVTT